MTPPMTQVSMIPGKTLLGCRADAANKGAHSTTPTAPNTMFLKVGLGRFSADQAETTSRAASGMLPAARNSTTERGSSYSSTDSAESSAETRSATVVRPWVQKP